MPKIHNVENTVPVLMVQGNEIQQGRDKSKPGLLTEAERSSPKWRKDKETKKQETTLSCLQRRSGNWTLACQRMGKADPAKSRSISKETLGVELYKASQRARGETEER